MSQRKSFKEGLSFGLASFVVMAVLGVGSTIVIARVYGIEAVGAFALALAPVGLCGALSTVQEQAALMRELAVLPARDRRISGLFAVVLGFSLALTTVVALIASVIAYLVLSGPIDRPDLVAPSLVLMAEYALLSNTMWNLEFVFNAFRAGRELFWIRLAHALIYLGVAIAASSLAGVWGLVVAQVVATAVGLVIRVVAVRPYMRLRVGAGDVRTAAKLLPDMLRFGVKIMPAHIADGASGESGTWVLGLTAPVATVGAWSRASQLMRRLLDPTYRVADVLFPTLIERRAKGDHEGASRAFLESSRLVAAGLLLLAAIAGGAADGVMDLYGPGFDQAAPALAILLLVPVGYCLSTLLGMVLLAVDKPLAYTKTTVWRTLLIFVFGVPLALAAGPTGMAIGTSAAYVLGLIGMAALARPHLATAGPLLWPVRAIGATLAAYGAGLLASFAVDTALPGPAGVLAALVVGTAAFAGVFFAAGGVSASDRERLARLAARVRRRPAVPTPTPLPSE